MAEYGIKLDEEGKVYIVRDGIEEAFDFNAMHRGYLPECEFTAAAWTGGLFYLAGVDGEGTVHLFSSLRGGVWEERNVNSASAGEIIRPESPVIKILHDEDENQTFLVCRMGQLVTLPDCPKCVKIRCVRSSEVSDAQIDGGYIVMCFTDGAKVSVPVRIAAQYRVSESFAIECVRRGAVLVDLRTKAEYGANHLPGAVNVEYAGLESWMSGARRDYMYIFVCRTGVQSDEAAYTFRSAGFMRSFSLGGMIDAARVK